MKRIADAAPVSIGLVRPRRRHRNKLRHKRLHRSMLVFDGAVGAS